MARRLSPLPRAFGESRGWPVGLARRPQEARSLARSTRYRIRSTRNRWSRFRRLRLLAHSPDSAKGRNVTRPRAADDFATIRARMEELRRQRTQALKDPRVP